MKYKSHLYLLLNLICISCTSNEKQVYEYKNWLGPQEVLPSFADPFTMSVDNPILKNYKIAVHIVKGSKLKLTKNVKNHIVTFRGNRFKRVPNFKGDPNKSYLYLL